MLKLKFLALILLFLSLPSGVARGSDDDYDDHVEASEQDVAELEKKLLDFKSSQQEVLNNLDPEQKKIQQQIQKAVETGDEKRVEELSRELAISLALNSTGKMNEMVSNSLKLFQNMPEIEVRAHLLKRSEGNIVGQIFREYPKTLTFAVKLLRDPLAIPQFLSITQNKTRLFIFIGINILLWVISLVIKKIQNHKRYRLGAHFRRWLFFFCLRLALFIGFFQVELRPLYNIARMSFT